MQTTDALSQGTERLDGLTNRMSSTVERSKQKLGEMGTNLVEKSKEMARFTDGCVHRNVWTAILSSAAMGLVIGMLINRRG
jgi:ElaB/YqjD/DUF883 family membrane-anchored ribosome-binding protein